MVASIPVKFLNAGLRFAGLFALCVIALAAAAAWRVTAGDERVISMYNIHTKETLTIAYKRNGQFIPEAMQKINHFMRDWRANEVHKMDPDLVDLMWALHAELGSREPMRLISGYRSPRTNESLRRTRGGQAKFSQHMLGKAADIQFPDIPLKQLRYAALIQERGGVGYYPTSGEPFVHVDTGSVRAWPKVPRMELALLFPSGKSRHIPREGRPLSRDDVRVAMASLRSSGGELPLAVRRHLKPGSASGPVLASYSPGSSPIAAKLEKAVEKPGQTQPSLPAGDSGGVTARNGAATKPQTVALSAPVPPSNFRASPEQLLPTPSTVNAPSDEIATVGAEYDDEDPDEANYHSFPLAPLMTEASVASVNFDDQPRAPVNPTPAMIFAEADGMLSFGFEQGLQYANLYWASRFAGSAVSNVLASQAAKRSLVAGARPQQQGQAPTALANNAPQRSKAQAKAPAAAAPAPAPVAVAAATPKQPAKTQPEKSPAEKSPPPPAVATASVAGSSSSSSDSDSSGSSLWSSIFSAPSVSYGFNPGE